MPCLWHAKVGHNLVLWYMCDFVYFAHHLTAPWAIEVVGNQIQNLNFKCWVPTSLIMVVQDVQDTGKIDEFLRWCSPKENARKKDISYQTNLSTSPRKKVLTLHTRVRTHTPLSGPTQTLRILHNEMMVIKKVPEAVSAISIWHIYSIRVQPP